MITIITGVPGAGKTLYTVSEMPKEYEGREIYYNNIPGLQLDWKYFEDPKEWKNLPSGALLIVDEAHMHFPKRPNTQKEPAYIQDLTTHRHQGLDLVLITQFPKQLDVYIRRLAGRHIHVEKGLIANQSATVYVWPKYQEWYENKDVRELADTFDWSYPKDVFGQYKSAEVHTKHKRPVKKLKRAVAMVVIGLLVIGVMVNKLTNRNEIENEPVSEMQTPLMPRTTNSYIEDWYSTRESRIKGMPYTAQLYDEVTKPKIYPKLACVSNQKRCWCYTQQSSRVDVPEAMCRNIVERGYFDPATEVM